MTVTQRMCLSVSPWTVALISLLNCFQKRKNLSRRNALRKKSSVALQTICGSDGEAKLSVAEVLSVKNLPVLVMIPPRKKLKNSNPEENLINYQHTVQLLVIWSLALACGLCSEQALQQPEDLPCSLTRSLTNMVELFSLILTYPLPTILTICPYAVIMLSAYVDPHFSLFFCISPITKHFSNCAKTCLILSICYFFTIMPSLLVDLVEINVAILMLIKYSLASLHIIFEPLVILFMRPSLLQSVLSSLQRRNEK